MSTSLPPFRYAKTLPKTNRNLRSNSGERSSYERGGCGVLGVAEKISSWEKVETLRKCTLYPAVLHCWKVTRYTRPVDAARARQGAVADVRRPEAFRAAELRLLCTRNPSSNTTFLYRVATAKCNAVAFVQRNGGCRGSVIGSNSSLGLFFFNSTH